MRAFYSLDSLPVFNDPVVTVGSYDGLHYGHRAILSEVKKKAAEYGGETVVVTFWPHPRKVLAGGGNVKLLNTIQEKLYLLKEAGIDNVVVLPFTEEFACTSYDEFVRDVLVGKIGMKHFVVGYNHRFGKAQEGDYTALQNLQEQLGFTTDRVQRHDVGEDKVSSTVLRNTIAAGDMKRAKEYLTRGYIVIADIREGNQVVPKDPDKLLPPPGSYSVTIEPEGTKGVYKNVLKISHEGDIRIQESMPDSKDVLITFV